MIKSNQMLFAIVGIYSFFMVLMFVGVLLPKSESAVQEAKINETLLELLTFFGGALVGATSVALTVSSKP